MSEEMIAEYKRIKKLKKVLRAELQQLADIQRITDEEAKRRGLTIE